MAHFDYTRPAGVWAGFTPVLWSEFADLDRKTFKSINGDDGGTWAPSSPIAIGGQGVEIADADLRFSGPAARAVFGYETQAHFEAVSQAYFAPGSSLMLHDAVAEFGIYTGFYGEVEFYEQTAIAFDDGAVATFRAGATLAVEAGAKAAFASGASAEFASGAIADFKPGAKAKFDGSDASLEARAEFTGAKAIASFTGGAIAWFIGAGGAGGALFTGGAKATFTSAGEAEFAASAIARFHPGSQLFLGGTTTFEPGIHELKGALVASGQGRVTKRIVNGDDADMTITPGQADIVYVLVISDNRTYTIGKTGAVQGDTMRVWLEMAGSGNKLTLKTSGGHPIEVLSAPPSGLSGFARGVELVFHDGEWRRTTRDMG